MERSVHGLRCAMKCALVLAIRLVLRCMWLIPLREKQVLFLSFSGKQYSDNPMYLSEELRDRGLGHEIVWALREPEKWRAQIPADVRTVPAGGPRYIFAVMTSKAIVTNCGISSYIPLRKRQVLLETWHGGGGFKRCDPQDLYDRFVERVIGKELTAVAESGRFATEELFVKSFGYRDCEFLRTGMPRNSILLREDTGIRQKVCSWFGIEDGPNTALLLYAPTYRDSTAHARFLKAGNRLEPQALLAALEERFHKRFCLLFRAHHSFAEGYSDGDYLNATDYPDMQELLYAADVLATDYSSCIWDMSLMKKPIFLYTPDLDEYLENRGFYCDFLNLPFPIARSQAALQENIRIFDQDTYSKAVEQYLLEMGSYESADAAKKVCDWLIGKINSR